MTTKRTAAIAMIGVLLLSGAASAGWWDDVGDAELVKLEDVLKSPRAYKGKEITFTCTFHRVSEIFNAYYTRFVPEEYVNFSVWPNSAKLWKKDEYTSSHTFMFLERDHKAMNAVMTLKRFTRLRLTGYVQNTFKGVPWIEVRHVEILDEALSKNSLREIIRGDRAADAGRWDEALAHFNSAGKMGLADDVQASVLRKAGLAHEGKGDHAAAAGSFAKAVELNPDDAVAEAMLEKMHEEMHAANAAMAEEALAGGGDTEKESGVTAQPVDPKRFEPEPMALPVPGEGEGEAKPEALDPETVEPVKPAANPEGTETPEAVKPVKVPTEPVVPTEEEPEKKKDPVNAKKRMSGPM